MSARGPLARLSLGLLFLLAGALAVVGGVAIRGAGLVAVLLAAVVAACVAAGVARESHPVAARQAGLDAAWRAVAWTVGGLLVVCGAGALAGPGAAALAVLLLLGALTARPLLARSRRGPTAPGSRVVPFPGPATGRPTGPVPAHGSRPAAGPLAAAGGPGWAADLTVAELGRAWVRSSAALAATRDPAARIRLVARRQQALDELERRDPEGFARWLAAGATIDSDPSGWVSPPSSSGSEAA
ncbi:hypothetical protein [Modestobacter sp. NPDC049651]|uniref:hypothetical protein n=1 Tax=unclassified Modestobacter TaxID=2643866 RepID=UPI0033E69A1C